MTPDIRRRVHAFRNALMLAADTRSNECFHMYRWKELNEFPHGCCDLASNFLAQYLKDRNPALQPVVLLMKTNKEFRDNENSTIEAHVILELDGWYIDLTLNQFAEYQHRVVIQKKNETLGSLLRKIEEYGGSVTEMKIHLESGLDEDGSEFYEWLHDTAESLLNGKKV
ncbi:TPA: hypothetical protein ONC18_004493 [Enterobacter kobei]|nr:hypothetical protein [Enterobacter kobei]